MDIVRLYECGISGLFLDLDWFDVFVYIAWVGGGTCNICTHRDLNIGIPQRRSR